MLRKPSARIQRIQSHSRCITSINPIATRSPSTRRPHDARDRANDTNKNHVIASSSSTHLTARANIHIRAVVHERDDRLEVALGARLVQLRQSAKGVVIVHPHFQRESCRRRVCFSFVSVRSGVPLASRRASLYAASLSDADYDANASDRSILVRFCTQC